MSTQQATAESIPPRDVWRQAVIPFESPNHLRSIWQIINSVIPFLVGWYLMYRSLEISYLLTIALAIPTGGFLMRVFILFHDCGHYSLFKKVRTNQIVGFILGILTFTPFAEWTHAHAIHHATAGDLDRRGVGDVWTMTVKEFKEAAWWLKAVYRVYRFPVFMFGFGPIYMFLINHRFANKDSSKRGRVSVALTNIGLLAIITGISAFVGFQNFLLVHLPIVLIGGSLGVWLFYVQHQFEGVYWEQHENWDYTRSALVGSSYFKMPRILRWFTGDIGVHHVHHLSPKIPNYRLQECHDKNPIFHSVTTIDLITCLKCATFRLWDETTGALVGYEALRTPSAA